MAEFAAQLSGQLEQPVTDATGLKGKYDFQVTWAPEMGSSGGAVLVHDVGSPMPTTSDAPGPTLSVAIQQQLGLRLEAKRGLVDVLVVDHMEKKPSDN